MKVWSCRQLLSGITTTKNGEGEPKPPVSCKSDDARASEDVDETDEDLSDEDDDTVSDGDSTGKENEEMEFETEELDC